MARRTTSREPAPLRYKPTGKIAAAFEKVLRIAMRFPGVEESRSYGTPAIKVKGKLIARLRSEDDGGLALACDMLDRHMLMQAAPEVFYITDHYKDYPWVLIDLEKVRWDAMPGLVENAWRSAASAKLVREYDGG